MYGRVLPICLHHGLQAGLWLPLAGSHPGNSPEEASRIMPKVEDRYENSFKIHTHRERLYSDLRLTLCPFLGRVKPRLGPRLGLGLGLGLGL